MSSSVDDVVVRPPLLASPSESPGHAPQPCSNAGASRPHGPTRPPPEAVGSASTVWTSTSPRLNLRPETRGSRQSRTGALLRSIPEVKMRIEGHTGSRGEVLEGKWLSL